MKKATLTMEDGRTLNVTVDEKELETTNESFWTPKIDDYYYAISDSNNHVFRPCCSDDSIDSYRLSIGNVFKTEEDAEQALKLLQARTRLRRSSSFIPDWRNDDQDKWFVYYSYDMNKLASYHTDNAANIGIIVLYATRKEAEQAIKDYKEDWLLHFGVTK